MFYSAKVSSDNLTGYVDIVLLSAIVPLLCVFLAGRFSLCIFKDILFPFYASHFMACLVYY